MFPTTTTTEPLHRPFPQREILSHWPPLLPLLHSCSSFRVQVALSLGSLPSSQIQVRLLVTHSFASKYSPQSVTEQDFVLFLNHYLLFTSNLKARRAVDKSLWDHTDPAQCLALCQVHYSFPVITCGKKERMSKCVCLGSAIRLSYFIQKAFTDQNS